MNEPYAERRRAVEWLAAQSDDPRRVRREWAQDRPALVPAAGPRFDTIRLPATIVHGAAGGTTREGIEAVLAAHGITSAVITDRPRRGYCVLVPPGTHRRWNLRGIECPAPSCRIALPAPYRAEPPGTFWLLSPPGEERSLCAPERVRALVQDRCP
ncbi:hypothetical protein I5Q34_25540 [Streptomyces sp. AV19]|uniref:hypothetical protein n=1 Tax=Streptomyces sp. AV19 TaxID=2793068 RepID=UPI0018FEBB73|nr:hypothetical protein [Streptomyces sp. AV19]MBH1937594.1 hypothetical protein [Streptomyces sp. AV19]MDG4536473.1 hypothetical protein [Streptomyces sp. AV19]